MTPNVESYIPGVQFTIEDWTIEELDQLKERIKYLEWRKLCWDEFFWLHPNCYKIYSLAISSIGLTTGFILAIGGSYLNNVITWAFGMAISCVLLYHMSRKLYLIQRGLYEFTFYEIYYRNRIKNSGVKL